MTTAVVAPPHARKTARGRATDVRANSPTPDATRRPRGTFRTPIERRRATSTTASANVFMSSNANTYNMAARDGEGRPAVYSGLNNNRLAGSKGLPRAAAAAAHLSERARAVSQTRVNQVELFLAQTRLQSEAQTERCCFGGPPPKAKQVKPRPTAIGLRPVFLARAAKHRASGIILIE